jgi:hypothetical protein
VLFIIHRFFLKDARRRGGNAPAFIKEGYRFIEFIEFIEFIGFIAPAAGAGTQTTQATQVIQQTHLR